MARTRITHGMSRFGALIRIEILPAAVILAIAVLHIFLVPDSPYWLDSPEFTASAFNLSLSHPPGHPLYEITGKLFTLLPAGSIAFRMNLFSTFCSLAAIIFVFLTCRRVMAGGFGVGRTTATAMASLAVIPLAVSPAWIHQATRSEVYSLEALILALVLWLSSYHLIHPPEEEKNKTIEDTDDAYRWMLAAVFFFSLSLCNHPFISILVLPALAAAVAAGATLRRWPTPSRRLLLLFAFLALGLLVYAYIPVRGNASPTMIMGKIENPSDFLWTLSAKVYQKSVAAHEIGLMTRKSTESIFLMLRESGLVLPFIALGGLYFLVRRKNLMPFGLLLAAAALITTVSRSFMPFDRNNPDIFGYMMIVMMIQVVAACGFLAAASKIKLGRVLSFIILLAIVSSVIAPNTPKLLAAQEAMSCPGRVMDALRSKTTDRYQPFSHVFSSFYSTTFLDLYNEKVLSTRPDLTCTGIAFLGYRGVASEAAKGSSEMKRVIRGYLVTGDLLSSDIATLALYYPVYLEPYPKIPDDFLDYMVPSEAGFLFHPQPVSIKNFKAAVSETNEIMEEFVNGIGSCSAETQTGRYLLWNIYNRSLLIARRGDADGAITSAKLGLKMFPDVPQLRKLIETLKKERKPLSDITPFLPPDVE